MPCTSRTAGAALKTTAGEQQLLLVKLLLLVVVLLALPGRCRRCAKCCRALLVVGLLQAALLAGRFCFAAFVLLPAPVAHNVTLGANLLLHCVAAGAGEVAAPSWDGCKWL